MKAAIHPTPATFAVQVPNGVAAGATIQVQAPGGVLMNVVVPKGAGPGSTFEVGMPAVAVTATVAVGAPGIGRLAPHGNLFIKQTKRGCLQEMMGCEANNEFKISTLENKQQDIMYALEDADFCCRLFCQANRTSKMNVNWGGVPGGEMVQTYDRPFRCAMGPCKCCCYQEMSHMDHTGQVIGKTIESYYYFVPSFRIEDEQQQVQYKMHMPTCVGGLCVDCFAEGCCNCRIPFYVYPADAKGGSHLNALDSTTVDAKKGGFKKAQLTKVWRGLGTELFTDAISFELLFPNGASPKQKALLLGSTFFLNMNFFEKQGGN